MMRPSIAPTEPPSVVGLAGIRLPLEDLGFAIETYLGANEARLDHETRLLLAGLRDGIGRVSLAARQLEAEAWVAAERKTRR